MDTKLFIVFIELLLMTLLLFRADSGGTGLQEVIERVTSTYYSTAIKDWNS